MCYIVQASTDIGLRKNINQDSLSVKIIKTEKGSMVSAVICDGMGGLSKGEVASASLVQGFDHWLKEFYTYFYQGRFDVSLIKQQWISFIKNWNEKIKDYGGIHKCTMGTTITGLLLTEKDYCILHVGDTRVYELCKDLKQITTDQTVVAREVTLGLLTKSQAAKDSRRNILLQCVGASEKVEPEILFGETKKDAVYLLCSDGFRHEILEEEIFKEFNPKNMLNSVILKKSIDHLIEVNKSRQEKDDISVIAIRTF